MTLSIPRQPARAVHTTATARPASLAAPRVWLLVGCIAAIAIASQLADPSAPSRFEPDLVTLLRGMAAIKTLLVAAAIGVLAWRFARPVTMRIASSYVVGAWLVTGATTMIWQLSSIVPASAAFHVGLLMLLVAAWRDEAPLGPRFAIPGRQRRSR